MKIVIDIPNPPSEQRIVDIPIHFYGGHVVDAGMYRFEERKTGKWVDAWRSGYGLCRYWYRKCSCCDYERDDCDSEKDTLFCPNCGAKMEVDDADSN